MQGLQVYEVEHSRADDSDGQEGAGDEIDAHEPDEDSGQTAKGRSAALPGGIGHEAANQGRGAAGDDDGDAMPQAEENNEIGRASCRERV